MDILNYYEFRKPELNQQFYCNVKNCGGGSCLHKVTDRFCKVCGCSIICESESKVYFCSNNNFEICEFMTNHESETFTYKQAVKYYIKERQKKIERHKADIKDLQNEIKQMESEIV